MRRGCGLLGMVMALLAALLPVQAVAEIRSLAVFELLPVLEEGRVMPMDSFARGKLLLLSGRSTFDRKPAAQWFARVLFAPESTRDDKIFLVNNPEVLEAIDVAAAGRQRCSYAELEPGLPELERLARAAWSLDKDARSPVEQELIRLYNNVRTYYLLSLALADPAATGRMPDPHARSPVALVPLPGHGDAVWVGPAELAHFLGMDPSLQRELDALRAMQTQYREGRQVAFDLAARQFLASIETRLAGSGQTRHLRFEVGYNKSKAFYRAEWCYGLAFLAVLVSLASRRRIWYAAAVGLTVLALLPHTFGIIARMVIMGRPPVTNLYATFIFVGWVCALLGLVMEYVQRSRLGILVAAFSGLSLLLTSGRFAAEGDTMGVMVAVLDSNFWLATHVVCITIGYAGCCVAGLIGHLYLLMALRHVPDDPRLKETYGTMYGALAFGLLFSFLGTMLGGIWADQSWGRFWGWDPKENGALLIVLWSAVVFHAKAGRMIGPSGFAAGSVIGVIWVLLAWLGVNLLGVGLHAYGFTSGLARGLAIACCVELAFALIVTPLVKKPTPVTS